VRFAVYFWVRPEQANVLAVSDRVTTAIKKALDAAGIDIPYPHSVILFHDATGTRLDDRASKPGNDLGGGSGAVPATHRARSGGQSRTISATIPQSGGLDGGVAAGPAQPGQDNSAAHTPPREQDAATDRSRDAFRSRERESRL
jgi:hypothetical protein